MLLRKKAFWGIGLAGALALGGLAIVSTAERWNPHLEASSVTTPAGPDSEPDDEQGQSAISVKTVLPKREPSFGITIQEPAYVEAYYQADLQAHVAGPVKFLQKAIGDPVKDGELLAEIEVPDLVEALNQAKAVVEQRKKEEELAKQKRESVQAAADVAKSDIALKEALVGREEATKDLRLKRWNRFIGAAKEQAVDAGVVEEEERGYVAAKFDCEAACAAVVKAKADWKEALANLEVAKADVNLKHSLVNVAEKDRDRAQALADYAKIRAPFDGVITRRNVDPGSFVQNASTVHPPPLLTVERTDIVTVHMKVPDNWAPYVQVGTEAIIVMSELPGQTISAKVTRRCPSLQNPKDDRTMRVEVDLYNGTEAEYQRFLATEKNPKFDLKDLKGHVLPVFPRLTGQNASGDFHPLLPGMYGEMRLVFRKLQNAYLIPSDAIVRHGGTPYIYKVENGKAQLIPVEVQVDDQKVAKVAVISRLGKGKVKRDLTGEEEIVISNQGELSEGQAVKATRTPW
jgi:multidrug resistance efflux pump